MDPSKHSGKTPASIPTKQGGELLVKKLSEALSNQEDKEEQK